MAATLDSLMPHPSCHSLRMSEAESHHSLHMHMQSLIELAPPLPHTASHGAELDAAGGAGAGLEERALQLPHVDSEQRIVSWILNLDACDPELPLHDQEFDGAYERLADDDIDATTTTTPKSPKSPASPPLAAPTHTTDDVESSCCDRMTSISDVISAAPPLWELMPMGSTAKTMHVAQRHSRTSSLRRSPSPPTRGVTGGSDARPTTPNSRSSSSSKDVVTTHL